MVDERAGMKISLTALQVSTRWLRLATTGLCCRRLHWPPRSACLEIGAVACMAPRDCQSATLTEENPASRPSYLDRPFLTKAALPPKCRGRIRFSRAFALHGDAGSGLRQEHAQHLREVRKPVQTCPLSIIRFCTSLDLSSLQSFCINAVAATSLLQANTCHLCQERQTLLSERALQCMVYMLEAGAHKCSVQLSQVSKCILAGHLLSILDRQGASGRRVHAPIRE